VNDLSAESAAIGALKMPPFSLESEQAVLGVLLNNNEMLDVVRAELSASDFYRGDHREIFAAICALADANKTADVITVAVWLKERGRLDDVGFKSIAELAEFSVGAANLKMYVEIVHERAVNRAILSAAIKMQDVVYAENGKSARAKLDAAHQLLAAVDERCNRGVDVFRGIAPILTEFVSNLENAEAPQGIKSGLSNLDRTLLPMMPGQLIVIGARPAVGKTSLAVNMAMHAVMHQHKSVMMFSLEMSDLEIITRIVSGRTGLASEIFRARRVPQNAWDRINSAVSDLTNRVFEITQPAGITIERLVALAKEKARQMRGVDLIVVDYIQLMGVERRNDNRSVEIGAISQGLKQLAIALQCPVIAASQLNRDSSKTNRAPTMAELRDSGSIEADADKVILIHRPYVVSQNNDDIHRAELWVAKQRGGPIGMQPVDYDGSTTQFLDWGTLAARKSA
jgi:replicative DNA helicase